MELHLDTDGLEGLFNKLYAVPELILPKAGVHEMLLAISEMEVGSSRHFQLPASWKDQDVSLDLSITMSDVDVPETSVAGNPALLAKIKAVAKTVSDSEEQELLEAILSGPRPAPIDEKTREAEKQATLQAAKPVLEDLAKVGYPVTWITNLSACGKYEKAVPVLLEWLPRTDDDNVKAAIAAALQVPWLSNSAAPVILDEFLKTAADSRLKFTLGACLGNLANPDIAGSLVKIVLDKKNGKSRQMLIAGLGKVKQIKVSDALITLLEDPEVRGQAIIALGEMRASIAAPAVEKFLNDAQPWVRREAAKALKRMAAGERH